jgi:hypothetical protein
MRNWIGFLHEFAPKVTVFLLLLTVVASVGANSLAAFWSRRNKAKAKGEEQEVRVPEQVVLWITQHPESPSAVARESVVSRLKEVARAREERLSIQKSSKIAANLLIVTQYVIGGALASSFVQQALSPTWVGGFGVLVLIASLIQQQFHPGTNALEAKKAATKLTALIRQSEDQLADWDRKIVAGEDHSDALIALLNKITGRLNEIDESMESTPVQAKRSAT